MSIFFSSHYLSSLLGSQKLLLKKRSVFDNTKVLGRNGAIAQHVQVRNIVGGTQEGMRYDRYDQQFSWGKCLDFEIVIWVFPKIGGKPPKWIGLFHGKPY